MDIDIEKYIEELTDWAIHFIPRLLLAALVLFIGFYLVKRVIKIVERKIERSEIDEELSSFLKSILRIVLRIAVVLAAIAILGVKMSALVALIAATGFAIGMALQGFLGNFAAGITIVFLKPYRVGDWVEVSESFGKVKSIGIFNTILKTPGDKTLVIPNGEVTENIITNYSTEGRIRLELSILIGYELSYPKVEKVIREALSTVDSVINDPPPFVGIINYDTHNIEVTIRPYIEPDQYWQATFEVNQAIKKALSDHDIPMAYSEGVELGPIGD